MLNRIVFVACCVLASLGCELEKADAPPTPEDPLIAGNETGTQSGAICTDSDPEVCASGYFKEVAADGARVYCTHVIGCPVVEFPCKHGEQRGDPTFIVLCQGARP